MQSAKSMEGAPVRGGSPHAPSLTDDRTTGLGESEDFERAYHEQAIKEIQEGMNMASARLAQIGMDTCSFGLGIMELFPFSWKRCRS